MKSLLAIAILFSFVSPTQASCISLEDAKTIVKTMEIDIESFDRDELVNNLEATEKGFNTDASGEQPLDDCGEDQCSSAVHNYFDSGRLFVAISCTGETSYFFENHVEHD